MNTSHTPGPWIADTDAKSRDGQFRIYAKEDAERGLHGAIANTIFQSTGAEELANVRLIAAAPLMHLALEAHAAWHWAENTTGVSTFHENMELANYSQWLTARALAQAAGLPHTEDYSGVPRMLIGFEGARIDRATNLSAQQIVDRLIGDYREAIAKATNPIL